MMCGTIDHGFSGNKCQPIWILLQNSIRHVGRCEPGRDGTPALQASSAVVT